MSPAGCTQRSGPEDVRTNLEKLVGGGGGGRGGRKNQQIKTKQNKYKNKTKNKTQKEERNSDKSLTKSDHLVGRMGRSKAARRV